MVIICAWCGASIGTKAPLDDVHVSHGMCASCFKNHAPQNPYDEETQKELHQGWEDGAESAGLFGHNCIYTNGVLNKSER